MTLNVTATEVGVVQDVVVVVVLDVVVPPVVVLGDPDPLVNVVGQFVLVAVLYVPVAEVAEHTPGTLLADVSPQAGGTTEFRRMFAVNKAA